MESLTVQRKMEEFLKDCEQEKTRIMYENGEDLKEIENVQSIIYNGLEKLKGNQAIADSLRLTLERNSISNIRYKKNKRGGSYLSVGAIVGLI